MQNSVKRINSVVATPFRKLRSLCFLILCKSRLSDSLIYTIYYYLNHLNGVNIHNPRTFNEHVLHRMLHDRRSIFVDLADKIKVRDFISEQGLKSILIPVYGVFDSIDEVNIDDLESAFVIKTSHDSGSAIVVKDKRTCDIEVLLRSIKSSLSRNYYLAVREWHYKDIPPKIIIEKLLLDENDNLPISYKIYCINGAVEFIHMVSADGHSSHVLDKDWNELPFMYNQKIKLQKISKPEALIDMMNISNTLSQGFSFLRIDLYNVKGKVYFGEVTINPNFGMGKFYPKYYDTYYGEKISESKELLKITTSTKNQVVS